MILLDIKIMRGFQNIRRAFIIANVLIELKNRHQFNNKL